MRAEWIGAVKRRLGLIEPGDPVSQRMEQWEQDHAEPDPRIAFCAKGRELDTSLALELYDEHVSEVRGHPWLTGNEMWLYRPEPMPLADLFRQVKCPGCFAMVYEGWFDPYGHYSFCWIAHPPIPPLNLGACGIDI